MIENGAVWLERNIRLPGVSRLLASILIDGPKAPPDLRGAQKSRWHADGTRYPAADWEVHFRGGYELHLMPVSEAILPAGGVAAGVGRMLGAHTLTMA